MSLACIAHSSSYDSAALYLCVSSLPLSLSPFSLPLHLSFFPLFAYLPFPLPPRLSHYTFQLVSKWIVSDWAKWVWAVFSPQTFLSRRQCLHSSPCFTGNSLLKMSTLSVSFIDPSLTNTPHPCAMCPYQVVHSIIYDVRAPDTLLHQNTKYKAEFLANESLLDSLFTHSFSYKIKNSHALKSFR